MTRDSQRAKVYAAEQFVRTLFDRAAEHGKPVVDFFGTTLTLPPEGRFASVASVQRYVDDVLAHPAVRDRWPGRAPLRVRSRRGATAAHYERDGDAAAIAVPEARSTWALRELVVFFGHFTAVYSTIPVQRPESHDGGCRNRAFGCP
ncbi:TIGR04338 family metallohydrolase [Mycolicibacterium sp.]|uniref:TIGR04338 family metallohydrolase n=1 Tax=Mycolicibacterium sp. TaxID=2320850 RepID=UPI003D0ED351